MEVNSEPENPGSPERQQVPAQPGAPSTKPGRIPGERGGPGRVWRGPREGLAWVQAPPRARPRPPAGPAPPGPSPRPCPSCEAGNRAARIRCCCRAVRSSAAESRPELGRLGCTRSRDPAARDPSLRRRRPQGAPGRTMVKVTFNSALAQKEAKKDDPKSSEEALIIPPDAVAVDCKVRAGVAGGVPAEGTGAPSGPPLPGYRGACVSGGTGSRPWRPPRGQLQRRASSGSFCTWFGRRGTCSDWPRHRRV